MREAAEQALRSKAAAMLRVRACVQITGSASSLHILQDLFLIHRTLVKVRMPSLTTPGLQAVGR